jgi:peptidyl-prolyl cis-trans isomerase SurA
MNASLSSARYFRLIFAAALLIFLSVSPGQARMIEKVVAIVNGEVITRTELEQAGKKLFTQIRQSTPAAELDDTLEKARQTVLTSLIDELLVMQKAKELNIGVSEEDLDNTIANISKDNNLTEAELYDELALKGVSKEEYRQKLASQIRRSKLINYEVRSKVVISEEKAREYYETTYSKQIVEPGYHLLQIGINIADQNGPDIPRKQAWEKAEGLRKLALAGQDFKELARSFSQLPSAKDGGDLGFFTAAEMSDSMKEIIIQLKPGQTSEIIEKNNSYQFYRLIAKNINGTQEIAPFEDVRTEIMELLRNEELDERYKNWLNDIKDRAIIKELE